MDECKPMPSSSGIARSMSTMSYAAGADAAGAVSAALPLPSIAASASVQGSHSSNFRLDVSTFCVVEI